MKQALSTREAARIVGLSEGQIRALLRFSLDRAPRSGRRYAVSFRDLVVLKAARELLDRRVPPGRVRKALRALVTELPPERPMSGLRIFAQGSHVGVFDGVRQWNPVTGQTSFAFDVDVLAHEAAESRSSLRPLPIAAHARERALREFERAIQLEVHDDLEQARTAYERALELDPQLSDARVNLGRLEHDRGNVPRAIELYESARAIAPEDPVVHFNLALAYEDHAGPGAAIPHYRRSLELDPDFADAHFNLARVHEQLGERMSALRHYQAYRKLTDS